MVKTIDDKLASSSRLLLLRSLFLSFFSQLLSFLLFLKLF